MNEILKLFKLEDWKHHANSILLVIAVSVIWGLIWKITDSAKDVNKVLEQHNRECNERVQKLEDDLNNYVKTVLFKDLQIKEQNQVIDNLKRKEH